MSKQLMLVPKCCNLSSKDKEKLSKNGYLVIECDLPGSIRVVTPEAPPLNANDVAFAALQAIYDAGIESIGHRFAKNVFKQWQAQRTTEGKEGGK